MARARCRPLCGAIDGGARLWDPAGPWTSPALRAVLPLAGGAAGRRPRIGRRRRADPVAAPRARLCRRGRTPWGCSPSLVNLPNVSMLAAWICTGNRSACCSIRRFFRRSCRAASSSRRWSCSACCLTAALRTSRQDRTRRRWRGAFWWRLIGDADSRRTSRTRRSWRPSGPWCAGRRRSRSPTPPRSARRYVEILGENFGQPGFRELLDCRARPGRAAGPGRRAAAGRRPRAGSRRAGAGPGLREAETVDFTGRGRELVVDFLSGRPAAAGRGRRRTSASFRPTATGAARRTASAIGRSWRPADRGDLRSSASSRSCSSARPRRRPCRTACGRCRSTCARGWERSCGRSKPRRCRTPGRPRRRDSPACS